MKYLVVILLCLAFQSVSAQRWERLPFNGGPLDGMAQNPYDENEIVGYVRLGEMFRSTDGGRTWNLIEQDSVLWRESYLDITFDRQGRIYVLNVWGLWRSEDHGTTWTDLAIPTYRRFGGRSNSVQVTTDGTILVYNESDQNIYTSVDDGETWSQIPKHAGDYIRSAYVDEYNPDLIVLQTPNTTVVTTNGGTYWLEAQAPDQMMHRLSVRRENAKLIFSAIGGSPYDLYESLDTCRTWRIVTTHGLPTPYGCNNRGLKWSFFSMGDSVLVLRYCDIMVRSTDDGQTFNTLLDNQNEYELLRVGDRLVASVSLDGVVESDDYGETWHPVSSPPQTLNYEEIEFAVARQDTMFALVADEKRQIKDNINNFRYRAERLFMSVNGGHTWEVQYASRHNHGLTVDAGTPARYYMLVCESSDRFSLITGVAGQSVPDTIYTYKPGTHPWQNWDVRPSQKYPGYLYATKYDATIGWSSDRGENWNWSTWPLYVTGMHPWPLQLDPAKMMVTAWQDHWLYDEDEGIYIATDRAQKLFWTYRGPLSHPLSERLYAGYDDRLFKPSTPELSSTDFGATWDTLKTGLDPGTEGMRLFQTHEEVLLHTNTGIYQYQDDRWRKLQYSDGSPVFSKDIYGKAQIHDSSSTDPLLISVEKYGNEIYVMIPKHGLYHTSLSSSTHVENAKQVKSRDVLRSLYPNPASQNLVIELDNTNVHPVIVRISDVLGNIVWEATVDDGRQKIIWGCVRSNGARVNPGVYFISATNGGRYYSRKVLVGGTW